MKHLFYIAVAAILSACAGGGNSEINLYKEYAEAFDEFAKVMPVIGGDSVSTWAADTVHLMAKELRKGNYSQPETMARIAQMQDYTAYGLSYVSAIMAGSMDPSVSKELLGSIGVSDSIFRKIHKDNYSNPNKVIELSYNSYYHLQIFLHLLNIIKPDHKMVYDDSNFQFSTRCLTAIKRLQGTHLYTDQELYRVSSVIENVVFFNCICPMAVAFSTSQNEFSRNREKLQQVAEFFDHYATPLFNSDATAILQMTDKEYLTFLKKSIEYRTDIIRTIADEVSKMSDY